MDRRRDHVSPSRSRHQEGARGFLQLEVLWGILLIGMLLGLLTVATMQQDKAERKLAARRAMARQVEAALVTLQAGGRVADQTVRVKRLETPAPAQGFIWVEVSAADKTATTRLVGLVSEKTVAEVSHETR